MVYYDNDNCMNCPFSNKANDHCNIREEIIENAMWTYCINHPHYNKTNISIPLGPMYSFSREHCERSVVHKAPDEQTIKDAVLAEAEKIKEVVDYHCIELDRDVVIVLTLGEYKDERAVEILKRIKKFNVKIEVSPPAESTMWSREQLIKAATQSLSKIIEPEKQFTPEQREVAYLFGEVDSLYEMV